MASARLTKAGETAVRALIARYNLHGRMALPVPIRQIARDEGWRIHYTERLAPLYGFAVVHGSVHLMQINADVTDPYQRFAIAHEMGHVLNGDRVSLHLCAAGGRLAQWTSRRMERQADLAAARLLIPPAAFEAGSIAEIAAACEVPRELVELLVSGR